MNLWGHRFSLNANQKFEGFLPYPLIIYQGRNTSNFWLVFWEKLWPHKLILNLTDLYIVIKCCYLGTLTKKFPRLMWLFFFSGKHDLWRAQTCWTHGRHRDSLFDFLRFCPKPQWECLQVCINQLCKSYNVQHAHYGSTGYGVSSPGIQN